MRAHWSLLLFPGTHGRSHMQTTNMAERSKRGRYKEYTRHSNPYKFPAARRQNVSKRYLRSIHRSQTVSLHGFRCDHDFEFEDDVIYLYLAVTAMNNSATMWTKFFAQIVEGLQTRVYNATVRVTTSYYSSPNAKVCTHVLSRRRGVWKRGWCAIFWCAHNNDFEHCFDIVVCDEI